MAACEKCWRDAASRERSDTSKTQGEHYRDLIHERQDSPCTPEEQCGELHLIFDWESGPPRCRCGARVEPLESER